MTRHNLLDQLAETDEDLRLDEWAPVDVDSIPREADRELFSRRKAAIAAFIRGEKTLAEISKYNSFSKSEIYRLLRRCFERDPYGGLYGYAALVPHAHIKPYRRSVEGTAGFAGKLNQLFRKYPDLQEYVDDLYLGRRKAGLPHEPQIQIKSLHKRFKDKCRQLGVGPDEYPFSAKLEAREALRKYVIGLKDSNYRQYVLARHGEESAKNADALLADGPVSRTTRPYSRVQLDAHRIDLMMIVWIDNPDGTSTPMFMERVWLLLLVDEASRATLGYHLSLNAEPTKEDVLQCVLKSIVPWKPRDITIPGLEYEAGDGFPSGVLPQCAWRLFDRIRLDNAFAHLSPYVQEKIMDVTGATVNLGKKKTPKTRAIIERLNGTLEKNNFHRIPSTTGSNPQDSIRRNPEKWAQEYGITFEEIEQVIEVVLAGLNNTGHAGIHGRTPLAYIRYFAEDPKALVRKLAPEYRDDIPLFEVKTHAVVRGKASMGRRPYIQYLYVPYQNEALASVPSLVGTRLTLTYNLLDLRFIRAALPNGTDLGLLRAAGEWGVVKHSERTRRTIFHLISSGELKRSRDPIHAYQDHLASKRNKRRRAVNQTVALVREVKESAQASHDTEPAAPGSENRTGIWKPRKKDWVDVTKTTS